MLNTCRRHTHSPHTRSIYLQLDVISVQIAERHRHRKLKISISFVGWLGWWREWRGEICSKFFRSRLRHYIFILNAFYYWDFAVAGTWEHSLLAHVCVCDIISQKCVVVSVVHCCTTHKTRWEFFFCCVAISKTTTMKRNKIFCVSASAHHCTKHKNNERTKQRQHRTSDIVWNYVENKIQSSNN